MLGFRLTFDIDAARGAGIARNPVVAVFACAVALACAGAPAFGIAERDDKSAAAAKITGADSVVAQDTDCLRRYRWQPKLRAQECGNSSPTRHFDGTDPRHGLYKPPGTPTPSGATMPAPSGATMPAPTQQPPILLAPVRAPPADIETRLENLKILHARGLITGDEYTEKRKEIVRDDIESRLRMLKELYDEGLISDDEWEKKRLEVLQIM